MMGLTHIHHVKGSRENSIGKHSTTYNMRVMYEGRDTSNGVICAGNERNPA